jgi:Protein of unknown function (DUF3843)
MSEQLVHSEATEDLVESHLPRIQNAIAKSLTLGFKAQSYDTLKLNKPAVNSLAAMLVELAAYLNCEIGIWRCLERFNTELFGAPLPFRLEQGTLFSGDAISPARLQHFLWVIHPQLIPNLVLRPDHANLVRLAEVASGVLQKHFARLPKDSSAKRFLGTPDKHGWSDDGCRLAEIGNRENLRAP